MIQNLIILTKNHKEEKREKLSGNGSEMRKVERGGHTLSCIVSERNEKGGN